MKSERSWGRLDLKYNIWKDCRQIPLPELLDFIVDNRGKTVPTVNQNEACSVVLIATNCIRNENLYPIYEKIRFISEDTYKTWFRSHPIPGDIIFVNKGTPGRVCLCPDIIDFCIAQDMMAFRADSNKLYNKYLLAVLRSRMMQEQIRITSVGDTIPHFKKEFLKDLYIPVPPMEIQRIIGDYYYNLSQKIELNKKINENLEQQISEYFKTMFSDVLDINGQDTLEKLISFSNGKKRPIEDGQIPVYGGNGILAYTNKANSSNCVIIGRVGAYCGNVCLSLDNCWISDNAISAKSRIGESQLFVFNILKNAYLPNRHIGSGQPLMTQGILKAIPCSVPKEKEIIDFETKMTPLQNMINAHNQENQRLSALRDTLLPKLMSGEIDVSNVRI